MDNSFFFFFFFFCNFVCYSVISIITLTIKDVTNVFSKRGRRGIRSSECEDQRGMFFCYGQIETKAEVTLLWFNTKMNDYEYTVMFN